MIVREFTLEVENELHVRNSPYTRYMSIELLDGLAEIFGAEMVCGTVYRFPPDSLIAVFSFQGCRVRVIGSNLSFYIVRETLMILHVCMHAYLEELRILAEKDDRKGPVTMVVGPTDVGKSSLCRFLLNYAARMGRKPFLIDINLRQYSLSIPGTMNIVNVEKPADIIEGFDQEALQTYQFGFRSPGKCIVLYYLLIKRMGQVLQSCLRETNRNARSSGVIINSFGYTKGEGYKAITLAALSFEIDTLVVVEEERLYLNLKRDMPASVNVLFIPKMRGVGIKRRPARFKYMENRVEKYFYGPAADLDPHTVKMHYCDIKVFTVKMRNLLSVNIFSDEITLDNVTLKEVPLGNHLLNQVLAISSADNVTDDIILENVIGFICVTCVDIPTGTITVLSHQPGPLPKKIFFMGEIKLNNYYID